MLLGWVGVVATVAATLFVHRIYSGQAMDVRSGTELSALMGADQDSDASDEEGGKRTM